MPDELLAVRPEIEWRRVRGIGNVLRHEYHGLSDKIIWGVVVDELRKAAYRHASHRRGRSQRLIIHHAAPGCPPAPPRARTCRSRGPRGRS
nr:HepT-like ribonuclease domain-containing protein [Pseudorhizobium halotolerans]